MYPSEQRFLLDQISNRFMIIWDLVTTKGDLIDMNDILELRKRFSPERSFLTKRFTSNPWSKINDFKEVIDK